MIRRFGEPPAANTRYTVRAGVYAILPRAGRVLLTFQAGEFNEFQLPGGGIDFGEHPIAALHREVIEETGWTISKPRKLGTFKKYTYMPEYEIWAEKVCSIYLAKPIRRLSDPLEKDHTDIWVTPEKAMLDLHNAGDRHFAALVFGSPKPKRLVVKL